MKTIKSFYSCVDNNKEHLFIEYYTDFHYSSTSKFDITEIVKIAQIDLLKETFILGFDEKDCNVDKMTDESNNSFLQVELRSGDELEVLAFKNVEEFSTNGNIIKLSFKMHKSLNHLK